MPCSYFRRQWHTAEALVASAIGKRRDLEWEANGVSSRYGCCLWLLPRQDVEDHVGAGESGTDRLYASGLGGLQPMGEHGGQDL
jgi:hypothetical protein